jgi:hypothetical protein
MAVQLGMTMGSDYTDIDNLLLLLFELGVISEEMYEEVLDSTFFWPTHAQTKIYNRY